MTSVPFIAFYPSDWRGGVSMLTDFEELVYLKICLSIWDDGKPVHEDDVPRLFRRAPDEHEVKAACASLVRLRKLKRSEDGLLTNARAVKAHREAGARSKAGKKGASSRWKAKRKRENATALRQQSDRTAAAVRGQCQPEPELEPEEKGDPPPYPPPSNGHAHLTAFMDRYTVPAASCDAAVAAYNELAAECDLPVAGGVLGQAREDNLRRRLVECGGLEGWKAALEKVRDSPMLRGQNDDGWKADLTFLVKQQNFIRLMEGGYDRSGHGPSRKRTQREITANGLSAFREALDE